MAEQINRSDTLFASFVERFGASDTVRLIMAAAQHEGNIKAFIDVVNVAIDWECLGRYAVFHDIEADPQDLLDWVCNEVGQPYWDRSNEYE